LADKGEDKTRFGVLQDAALAPDVPGRKSFSHRQPLADKQFLQEATLAKSPKPLPMRSKAEDYISLRGTDANLEVNLPKYMPALTK
jgi:hypothetical protein